MFLNQRKIILGNWKMNKNLSEINSFFKDVESFDGLIQGICPQSPYLSKVEELRPRCDSFLTGAQNISSEVKGAYTGEISTKSLIDFSVKFTLVGHSERRQLFNESDSSMIKKISRAMEDGLGVVYCVGETLEQREANQVKQVLFEQLNNVLPAVKGLNQNLLCIAYEPVWAIGTGKTASANQAVEAHKIIGGIISESLSEEFSSTPILYGGSVKPSNAQELLENTEISGALIGGASLSASDFNEISRIASNIQA
jgi:triosephosphate isomerase (TIM)